MSKPTPGPCVVIAPSLPKQPVAAWICTVGNNPGDPAVFSTALGPNGEFLFGDKQADAALIAEAFTVHHETGLTPQQLREQRDELMAVCKALAKEHRDILASGDCGNCDPSACDELIAAESLIASVEAAS